MESPLAILCAFANTAGPGRDDIATADALAGWLGRPGPVAPGDHRTVLAFRDGVRDLIGGAPGGLDAVNDALCWLGAPPRLAAVDRIALSDTANPDPGGVRDAIAPIAAALVDAVGSGQLRRLRLCAGCRTAFAGGGRGRGARWCDMATCGNRAKVAAFRARHRDDQPRIGEPDGPARSVDEILVRLATRDRGTGAGQGL